MMAFVPFGNSFPIHSITVAVDFDREINESDISKFINNSSEISEEFPIRRFARSLRFKVDIGSEEKNYIKNDAQGITGVLLVKEDSEKKKERIAEFRGKKFYITDFAMESWISFKEKTARTFEKLLLGLPDDLMSEGIHIQFRYQYHSVSHNPALLEQGKELFQANSPYLAPKCLSSSGVWHSHTGFCEDLEVPFPLTLITNLSIDVTETEPDEEDGEENQFYQRIVSLVSLHKINPKSYNGEIYSRLNSMIDFIFQRNTLMINQVLVAQYIDSMRKGFDA